MDIHEVLADTQKFWETFADTHMAKKDEETKRLNQNVKKAAEKLKVSWSAYCSAAEEAGKYGKKVIDVTQAYKEAIQGYNESMSSFLKGTAHYDSAQLALTKRVEDLKTRIIGIDFTPVARKRKTEDERFRSLPNAGRELTAKGYGLLLGGHVVNGLAIIPKAVMAGAGAATDSICSTEFMETPCRGISEVASKAFDAAAGLIPAHTREEYKVWKESLPERWALEGVPLHVSEKYVASVEALALTATVFAGVKLAGAAAAAV